MYFKCNSHVVLFQMHRVMPKLEGIDISKYLKLFLLCIEKLFKGFLKRNSSKYCFSDKTDFLSVLGNPS